MLEGGGVFHLKPGQITDDSEMAMCLVHSLTEERLNLDKITKYFCLWYKSPPFDIGITTSRAMKCINLKDIDPPSVMEYVTSYNRSSLSNGCLMRVTPLAVWGY